MIIYMTQHTLFRCRIHYYKYFAFLCVWCWIFLFANRQPYNISNPIVHTVHLPRTIFLCVLVIWCYTLCLWWNQQNFDFRNFYDTYQKHVLSRCHRARSVGRFYTSECAAPGSPRRDTQNERSPTACAADGRECTSEIWEQLKHRTK